MRILNSAPKDREFYNEHGTSLKGFKLAANFGQFLSGASMAVALFYIFKDFFADKGITTGTWGIVLVAIAVGLFVELANRFLIRPALRPLVAKDQFADRPEKKSRHKVLTIWPRALLLAFGGLSLFLSYVGSMDFGDSITGEAVAVNVDSLDNSRDASLLVIADGFKADTLALLAPFQIRSKSANAQFAATKAEREKAAQDFTGCANQGNKWCKKKRRAILADIDEAEASLNATLSTIAIERGAALTAAIAKRDQLTEAANAKTDGKVTEAKQANGIAANEREKDASGKGFIFAILTCLGQVAFYVFTYLVMQIEEGSEIERDVQPDEFYNKPSVLADFKAVLRHRTERGARRLIRKIFGDRDRLEKDVPFVSLWDDPKNQNLKPRAVMLAEGIDTELTQTDPVATNHAPRFYQHGDDPYNSENSRTPLLHTKPNTKAAKITTGTGMSTSDLKQRLKQYKKRLGEHKQKAKKQARTDGQVSKRTADAIANNQAHVKHYTSLLSSSNHNKSKIK